MSATNLQLLHYTGLTLLGRPHAKAWDGQRLKDDSLLVASRCDNDYIGSRLRKLYLAGYSENETLNHAHRHTWLSSSLNHASTTCDLITVRVLNGECKLMRCVCL